MLNSTLNHLVGGDSSFIDEYDEGPEQESDFKIKVRTEEASLKKANGVADEGYWWLYSCCCAFIQAGIATSDSCTKRLPGRVENLHYWFVSRGEETVGVGVWSYELTGGSRKVWAGGNTKRIASRPLLTMPHVIIIHVLIMYLVQGQVSYPYNTNNKLRFHARLALGSCGSQDFWGLSEWPASINEHGAIKSSSNVAGWTRRVRVNQIQVQPLLLLTTSRNR